MYCENCGAEIGDDFKFCPKCAKPVECVTFSDQNQCVVNANGQPTGQPAKKNKVTKPGVLVGKVSDKSKKLIQLGIILFTVAVVATILYLGYVGANGLYLDLFGILFCVIGPTFIAISFNSYLFGEKTIGNKRKIICVVLSILQIYGIYTTISLYVRHEHSLNASNACVEIQRELDNYDFDAAEDLIDSMPKYMSDEQDRMEDLLKVYKTVFGFEELNNDPEQYFANVSKALLDSEMLSDDSRDVLQTLSASPSYVDEFYNLQKPAKAYYDYQTGSSASVSQWNSVLDEYNDSRDKLLDVFGNEPYNLDPTEEFDSKALSEFSKYYDSESNFDIDWIIDQGYTTVYNGGAASYKRNTTTDSVNYDMNLYAEISIAEDDGFETGQFHLKSPDYDYQPECADLIRDMCTKTPVYTETDMQNNASYADLSFRYGLTYGIACDTISRHRYVR